MSQIFLLVSLAFFDLLLVCRLVHLEAPDNQIRIIFSSDFRIFPLSDSVITLPSNGVLYSTVSLTCAIEPQDYIHSSSWVTPVGDVVDRTTPRYVLINDGVLNSSTITTVLQIKSLSYADSGSYSCVVNSVDAVNPQRTKQARASIELRLSGITMVSHCLLSSWYIAMLQSILYSLVLRTLEINIPLVLEALIMS